MPDERDARIGLAMVRLTIGVMFVWVFFENLGKGLYTANGYAGLINYYIQHDHAPVHMEGRYGGSCKPRRDGGPAASAHRDFSGDSARPRIIDAPGGLRGVPLPGQPLGIGVGHLVDLGVVSSGARIAFACGGARRSNVGR